MLPPSFRRWARRLRTAAVGLLLLAVVLVGLLQLSPVATWLVRRALPLIPLNPGYHLEVGRVSGNPFGGLDLQDVWLRRGERELAHIDLLRARYDLRRLRGAVTHLNELGIDGARIVTRRENGNWDLANALRRSPDSTGHGGGLAVDRLTLREVQVEAQLAPDSAVRVRDLSMQARDLLVGPLVRLTLDDLNAGVAPPGSSRWFAMATRGAVTPEELRLDPLRIQTEQSSIAGRVILPRGLADTARLDRLDLRLKAAPLSMADLAAVMPSVAPEGEVRLDASATGEGRMVTAQLAARLDQATLTMQGGTVLERGKLSAVRVHAVASQVDPSRLYRTAPVGDVNGTLDADVQGSTLSKGDGKVDLRLDRSRMGGNRVDGFQLLADLSQGRADVRLRGRVGGGTLAASGRVRPFDSIPEYRLAGNASRMPGTDALARGLAGSEGEPTLDVRFTLNGAGISPRTARVTGRVDLDALRRSGERVPLGHATLALAAARLEARPTLLVGGGRVSALAVAHLGDTLRYEVRDGTIDSVDLGRMSKDTVIAPLTGRFALRGRGVTSQSAAVSAHLELDEVRYGERRVESITGDLRLERGRANVDMRGALQGGRLAVNAVARPFDSTAAFTVRRASLERVDLGTLLDRPAYAGPVTLHGEASGQWGAANHTVRGRVVVERSQLGHVEIQAGTLTASLVGQLLTYSSSFRTNAGTLALAGDGRPRAPVPSYALRQGRVDSLDLGALLGRPGLRTGLNASFSASVAGSGRTLVANASVDLLPSTINQAELRDGQLKFVLDQEALRGDLRLAGPDGEVGAKLSGRVGGSPSQVHADGSVRLERLARWTGRPDAQGRIEARYALDAATDSAGLLALGGTVNAVGGVGDARIQTLQLVLRPDSGAIRVDTLLLRSNVAVVEGVGSVALRGRAGTDTLRLRGRIGDLAPIAALAKADTVSLDSARVALAVTGPAWRWQVTGDADVYRLLFAGNLAEHLTLHATTAIDSTRVSATAGELKVKDAAYGRLSIPEAQVTARYDSLLAIDAKLAVGDSIHLDAVLRGKKLADTLRAVLQRLDLAEGGRKWSLEQPADLIVQPRVAVDRLALSAGNGRERVLVNGVFDRRGSSDLEVRLTSFELDAFRSAGLAPIGGRLDGFLHLTGPAAAPTLGGKVALTIRQRNGKTAGMVVTALDWNREALRIDAAAAPVTGGYLYVNGTLPWHFTLAPPDTASSVGVERAAVDTLALAVRADSFNLALFEPLLPPDAARDLRGKLQIDAKVGGTPEAPTANGTLHAVGVKVSLPLVDVNYDHGEFAGHLTGDELRIDRLRLTTGKHQEVVAQGVVHLRPLTEPGLDLAAKLHDFRISHSSTLQTSASGEVKLGGTALKPTLSGALTLGRTDVFVGSEAAAIKVKPVELTPEDHRKLARDFGPAVLARVKESPGLVSRFRLDLDLSLPERVWIRKRGSPSMDIEIAGQMKLKQEPGGEMQFFGQVEPVAGRGVISLNGREFRLTGGEIMLAGPTDSTRLDVTADYQVPTQGGGEDNGVLITVAAKGRLDSLGLTFSADPSMSQDDIFSYIVTGRPASDNPLLEKQTASQGNAGEQMAMGQLTSAISNTAGQNLGLDVFQIRQDPTRGLTLSAGRYISSRLFLNLQLPLQLGSRAQPTPGANLGPGFELEYAARRWLRADLRGGSLPPGFSFRGRHAY